MGEDLSSDVAFIKDEQHVCPQSKVVGFFWTALANTALSEEESFVWEKAFQRKATVAC